MPGTYRPPPRGFRLAFVLAFVSTATLHVIGLVRPASSQSSIGLYTDASGNSCSFAGNAPGVFTAYVVVRPGVNGTLGARFAAPVPSCLGAVYLGETVPPTMAFLGDSQTGISIALPICSVNPVMVLQINYFRSGITEPCCAYPIVPDPLTDYVQTTDCWNTLLPMGVTVSRFNADESCICEGNTPPFPPTDPHPLDNSTSAGVNAVLSWSATDREDNITEFDLYLGTAPAPPLVAAGLTEPTYAPGTLEPLTQYYWRVVVRDEEGTETSGPVWRFTTRDLNSPPYPPSFPQPTDGAQGVLPGTVLDWLAADIDGDAVVSDLYFGTSLPPPLVATGLTASTYRLGTLAWLTMYHWRVVVRDPAGLEAAGPVWSFTVRPENYPPTVPSEPYPANGSVNQPVKTTLHWYCSDRDEEPITYDVFFGDVSPPPLVATVLSTRSYGPGPLVFATKYYWRVVARDPRGAETPGPAWSFTTKANSPPNAPSSPSPPHAATNRPLTQTLAWQCSDVDGHTVTYDVYFGADAIPPLVASNISSKSHAPGALAFATRYYWRVVARDELGAERSGSTWYFTTKANSPPTAPSSPNPANNGATTLRPVLTWSAGDPDGDPLNYTVYFGTTSPPPLAVQGLTARSYTPGALSPTATYFWRVVASDSLHSTSGATWRFTAHSMGDADLDGEVTIADASCAMGIFLGTGPCYGLGNSVIANVDCSSAITPRDARCIHMNVLDGSCDFCGEVSQSPSSVSGAPEVAVGSVWTSEDTLNVILLVSNVPTLSAFGFFIESDYAWYAWLVEVVRRGATAEFTALEGRFTPWLGGVGGYSLSGVPATSQVELILLRFVTFPPCSGNLIIDGFVDDLAGARQVVVHGGGGIPVLFTRFSAVARGAGVEVSWELSSDERMERFVLMRRQGDTAPAVPVVEGPVDAPARSYLDLGVEGGKTYHYELLIYTTGGDMFRSPAATVTTQAVALALHQNHPNPFNPTTTIPYDLPAEASPVRVRLRVLDTAGRLVRTLVDEDQTGGSRAVVWDGRDARGGAVSSGVYFCILDAGGERRTRKVVLLK